MGFNLFSKRTVHRRSIRCWGPKGFTFVEVILSIVILMVGVVAVQKTLLGSLSAMSMIENWDQAEELLQQKIWEVQRVAIEKPKTLKPTRERSVLLGKNRTYTCDLAIRPIGTGEGLMEADVRVSWENRGIRHSLPRVFYLRGLDDKDTNSTARI